MVKFKIIIISLCLIIIGLMVFQNSEYFLRTYSISIDLKFLDIKTPEISNGIIILACFLIGFFISYVFNLFNRFKLNKTIKDLQLMAGNNNENMIKKIDTNDNEKNHKIGISNTSDNNTHPDTSSQSNDVNENNINNTIDSKVKNE